MPERAMSPAAPADPRVGADRPAKIERVRGLLATLEADGILLTTVEAVAWLLDGARVSVPLGGPSVVTAAVRADGSVSLRAPANEAERLRDEEVGSFIGIEALQWYAPLDEVADGWVVDSHMPDAMRALRAPLLPAERARYVALGGDVARAVTAVLSAADPSETETALASRLAAAVVEIGAEPVVLLVAGEGRTGVQHPLPTGAPLGRRAMAVVGARRHGLVVNLTRWITFGARAEDAERRLMEVEADAFAATTPGRPLTAVLSDIAAAYARHGFSADSWLLHHQGGPTGYAGRDPKVTPASGGTVHHGQAFAWNPWVPGAKLEDTVVVGERVEVLTVDPDWPTVTVRGVARPTALERN